MKGTIGGEATFRSGTETLVESDSPTTSFATFFEDDGDTGYFYGLDKRLEQPILDALQIYNVSSVVDRHLLSNVTIMWSEDGLKSALLINNYVHAVFDFESTRGYCRNGLPLDNHWSREGHNWSDDAVNLFF